MGFLAHFSHHLYPRTLVYIGVHGTDNSKVSDSHELCSWDVFKGVKQLKVLHPEQSLPHPATKPAGPECIKANPNPKPNPKPTLT